MVPSLSLVFMAVSCAVSFLVPLALLLYFHIKKKADIWPFFAGCLIMFVFAFVLEPLVHQIILPTDIGSAIQRNTTAMAIYGGLMAGIFEESGRLLAFLTILRRNLRKNSNALMYGAGHGGLEAMLVLGVTSIMNIICSVLINSQQTDLITDIIPQAAQQDIGDTLQTLATTPSWHFLMGSAERIFAIIIQIALSVLVWFAVKKKKVWLYLLAIVLHAAVDAGMVLLAARGYSLLLVEGAVAAMAVVYALIAWGVWRKNG